MAGTEQFIMYVLFFFRYKQVTECTCTQLLLEQRLRSSIYLQAPSSTTLARRRYFVRWRNM